MNLRLQELIVDSSGGIRSLTVQTTLLWKCIIGIIVIVGMGVGVVNGPVGMAIAAGVALLALLMASFTNNLIIDSEARQLVLRSGIGPLRGKSTIPFDSIKMVTISDGGTTRGYGSNAMGAPTPARAVYSLALEIAGRRHVKTLLNGVAPEQLVSEARNLAALCGKSMFIPSSLQ